jgi:hypothetical protein
MTAAELEKLALAQSNPFLDSVLRNGFEQPLGDVPEIHAGVREKLRASVEEVRAAGALRLQVVTGEPGDGKTHLLATLRAEAEESWLTPGHERAMVPIEPVRDPDAPFTHTLRALIAGLSRPLAKIPLEGPSTPIEFILWRILTRAVRSIAGDGELAEVNRLLPEPEGHPGLVAAWLRTNWPRVEPALVRGLHKLPSPQHVDADVWTVLCRFPREELSHLVLRWLGGHSLAEDDLSKLGVREPLDGEDRAYLALSTLLHLSDVPIVLGFDQLEGIARLGEDAVSLFLQSLADQLYSGGGRALVVLFCQADVWQGFQKATRRQVQDRLSQRPALHLAPMSPELGEMLVAKRLEGMWKGLGQIPPHTTFPYPAGFVRRAIAENGLRGPRRVLSWFANLGLTAAPPKHLEVKPKEPRQIAREAYSRIREEVAHETDRSPDEVASVAQGAMATILGRAAGSVLAGTQVVRAGRAKVGKNRIAGVEAKLAREGMEVTVYTEASNSQNAVSAAATVRRFKDALKKADRAFLLRDEKLALPRKAGKDLAELGPRAESIQLPSEDAASFTAVERLLNQAAARDIDVSPDVAAAVVLEEIAPKLEVVRRFLDAAFSSEQPKQAGDAESKVLAALSRPPFVASEAHLAKAHGVSAEEIARATDELEKEGKAIALRGKDGDRSVLRRPR